MMQEELYDKFPPFSGKNLLTGEKDISNKIFGKWKVLYRTENFPNSRTPRYVCQCECLKIKSVSKDNLIRGVSKSCGRCSAPIDLDIVDKREKQYMSNERFYALSNNAKSNNKKSKNKNICKNKDIHKKMSKNEALIYSALSYAEIDFQHQYYIIFNNNRCFFDFFISNTYIVEFDGEQHFKDSIFGQYQIIHNKDLIKNKYCFENNIPLIRIPYDVNWVYEDLFPSTSRFLLTPENEKYYYEKER